MNMFVVADIVLNATSLVGQTLDIKPPTTGQEIRPDHDQRRGKNPLIAGWTSTNPNVPPGHSLSGRGAGSLGFGVVAEWGARPRSERTLIR